MGRLRYLILGPLEVRDGNGVVALRGGQQRKLLAILLLHAGEAVSSERLIDELWHGEPPDTSAKALQGYVSSLRKQLGQEAIETVGAGYRLKVEEEQVDARHFEELLAEARPLERAPAAAKLREALALWRGPALADFAYDDFARHEIERLEELRQACLERRIDLDLALGRHDDLVPELEALVHGHPLRERLRRHLMVALYRSGRQAEALDAYGDARTVLRDELGLEPSEELQELQRAILAHDASLAAPPRVDVHPPARAARPAKGQGLRRPVIAAAVGLVIFGSAVTTIALTRGTGVAATIVVPPNSIARIDESGKRIESYVDVGQRPDAVAVGRRGVWFANADDGTVTRLDPVSRRSVPFGIGPDLADIAIGHASVWVADGNDGTVTKIDRHLYGEATIRLGGKSTVAATPVFFVAVGSGHVWATCGSQLWRIDPSTNLAKLWVKSVGTPTGLTVGGGFVWVTTLDERLLRIDPRMPGTMDRQQLPDEAIAPVYWRGSLWLIMGGQIQQLDPSILAVRNAVTAVTQPTSLAAGNGALWAIGNGSLTRLGPRGGVTASLHVGKSLSAVAAASGATWVAVSSPTG